MFNKSESQRITWFVTSAMSYKKDLSKYLQLIDADTSILSFETSNDSTPLSRTDRESIDDRRAEYIYIKNNDSVENISPFTAARPGRPLSGYIGNAFTDVR